MSKSTRIIKRFLALFLVVLMSINSLAAIVSDNDGSAFVTKAEFEAMKKDFEEQIKTYNSSIDNKIDGSIASYLAALSITNPPENYWEKLIENSGGEFWWMNKWNTGTESFSILKNKQKIIA